jgi:hypothetical protein
MKAAHRVILQKHENKKGEDRVLDDEQCTMSATVCLPPHRRSSPSLAAFSRVGTQLICQPRHKQVLAHPEASHFTFN